MPQIDWMYEEARFSELLAVAIAHARSYPRQQQVVIAVCNLR
jgi:hypothetical protein